MDASWQEQKAAGRKLFVVANTVGAALTAYKQLTGGARRPLQTEIVFTVRSELRTYHVDVPY